MIVPCSAWCAQAGVRHGLLYSADTLSCFLSFLLTHFGAGQDFAEEQNLVARMVHQLRSDDPDEHFQILKTARRHFSSGGPRRVKHTLPPLAFSAIQVPKLLHPVLLPATMESVDMVTMTMSTLLLPTAVHTLCPPAFSVNPSPGLLLLCTNTPPAT